MQCSFLQHCDRNRTTLSEPEWYAMLSIVPREVGGIDLAHKLSEGYPGYNPIETEKKISHALNSSGPATCEHVKRLCDCGRDCGVKSPVALAYKERDIGDKQKQNLTENLKLWLSDCFGTFTIEQIYRDLDVTNLKDKNLIRVNLHREVEKGIIEKGRVMGQYTVINQEADPIEILDKIPISLPIKWPGEIEGYVKTYPSNIIVISGSSNAGKTAFALNTAHRNKDQFEVFYLSSEMGSEELTLRTAGFDCPTADWKKINFRKRTQDFHQAIKPDALNIIDYLEVIEGKFYLIGDDIRKIYQHLNKGIALICLQMDKGATFAWGGQKTLDKARLYLTMDDNRLTIVKGKNWTSRVNPNGLVRSFSLHNGSKFVWEDWKKGV